MYFITKPHQGGIDLEKKIMIQVLLGFSLQIISFIPFYFIWRKDCKEIGKENLAVSLQERFLTWMIVCPIWALPIFRLTFKP